MMMEHINISLLKQNPNNQWLNYLIQHKHYKQNNNIKINQKIPHNNQIDCEMTTCNNSLVKYFLKLEER